MILYSISTVRLSFKGREWTRRENADMIEYCAELPSGDFEQYMFSGKSHWLYRKDRNSFWQSCPSPDIDKEYEYHHPNWIRYSF
jgi:hypothetical protein